MLQKFLEEVFFTSCLYSKKTLKFSSFLSLGWAASLHRNTSCIATVFLNVAKYSLLKEQKIKYRKILLTSGK